MEKELREKLARKEKMLVEKEKELNDRECMVRVLEKYIREREEILKQHLLEQGLSIASDEEAIFVMD